MRKEEASWPNLQYYRGSYVDGQTIGHLVIRLRLKPCGAKGPFLGQQSAVSIRV